MRLLMSILANLLSTLLIEVVEKNPFVIDQCYCQCLLLFLSVPAVVNKFSNPFSCNLEPFISSSSSFFPSSSSS